MEILPIGARVYSVYLDPNELENRGIDPDGFNADRAAELLCGEIPEVKGKNAYVETFHGNAELLIFVRIGRIMPEFYAMDGIETVIGAILSRQIIFPDFLTYIDGTYVLTLYPAEEELRTCEFGSRIDACPEFALTLREHGEFVLDTAALLRLRDAVL